ncbi:MAG TPA: hypothetical protein VIV60_18555 [Polyangiaceae bacterium]
MPWLLLVLLVVYGVASIVFAFKQPPEFLRHWFKVPAIFVFLPDRLVMPVGRVFLGVGTIGTAVFIATKFL